MFVGSSQVKGMGAPRRSILLLILYTALVAPAAYYLSSASRHTSGRDQGPHQPLRRFWQDDLEAAGEAPRARVISDEELQRGWGYPDISEHDLEMVSTFPQVFRIFEGGIGKDSGKSLRQKLHEYLQRGPQTPRFAQFQRNHSNVYVSMGPFIAVKALIRSLLHVGANAAFVVLRPTDQTPYTTEEMDWLDEVGAQFQWVDPLLVPEGLHPDKVPWGGTNKTSWVVAYNKFYSWTLTQFKKVVWLDADTLVLQNTDDLFYLPELTAASDALYGACDLMYLERDSYRVLDSGLMVLAPSMETFETLRGMLVLKDGAWPWEGGDQHLIETHFLNNWIKLPQSYGYFPYMCKCRATKEMGDKADMPLVQSAHTIQYTYNFYKPWQDAVIPERYCEVIQWRLWRWFAGEDRRVGFSTDRPSALRT